MRTLVLSLGNTSLFGGVFAETRLTRVFRIGATELAQLPARAGARVDRVALCSTVPTLTPKVQRLVRKTWGVAALELTATAAHGLTIGYRRPSELGADRVAAALGARELFPRKDVIVVDCGTATTVTALRSDGTLLGGAILPGVSLWPEMLAARTAQLPHVAPMRPRAALGRSPREGIASGVFFGHVGAIREVVARVQAEAFGRAEAVVVGTGGHARRFARERLFSVLAPSLILRGLQAFAAGQDSQGASKKVGRDRWARRRGERASREISAGPAVPPYQPGAFSTPSQPDSCRRKPRMDTNSHEWPSNRTEASNRE